MKRAGAAVERPGVLSDPLAPAMAFPFSRRTLLGSLPFLGLGREALAFGEGARFVPGVAQHGGRWDGRLSGLRRLAWELQRRTSVEVIPEARGLALTSPRLFDQPFLYFGGDGEFPALSAPEVEALRRYLTFGGFLVADANDGSGGRGFDTSFRRELARVLPGSALEPVPSTHVLFKTFYLLDSAPGRLFLHPQLHMVNLGNRAAVVYSQNDLAGAWERDESGAYAYEVSPGGEPQRELAVRVGINVCMYALCLDYKDDAVHLPLILKKRR
jgi:Domain of unknown function (DUF4159)